MITDILTWAQQLDLTQGEWCMGMKELDASSRNVGVAFDTKEAIIEDLCWLQPIKNTQHINVAELEVVLRWVNLKLKWQGTVLRMNTDSLCMFNWVTKAMSEIHIQWWLETLTSLAKEYKILIDIALVRSDQNQAD